MLWYTPACLLDVIIIGIFFYRFTLKNTQLQNVFEKHYQKSSWLLLLLKYETVSKVCLDYDLLLLQWKLYIKDI